MDVYKHIPSKDVREYLQKIEYKFSALEAAFLVWNNKNITLKEKHAAFKNLIRESPDEEIKRRINTYYQPSLHAFLKEYMGTEDDMVAKFYDNADKMGVYRYRVYCKGENGWYENYESVYRSYEEAIDALQYYEGLEVLKIQVKKSFFTDESRDIILTINNDKEVVNVTWNGIFNWEHYRLCDVFQGYWTDIPLPFKRGDIVCERRNLYDDRTEDGEPFVLESCHNWTAKDYKANGEKLSPQRAKDINRRYYRYRENGDITDTYPCGYGLTDGFACGSANKLYRHVQEVDFLSLEYYRGEFTGGKRILNLLSKRMKREIDDELFAHGHFLITQEEYLKEYKKYMDFRSDIWEELGIQVEK